MNDYNAFMNDYNALYVKQKSMEKKGELPIKTIYLEKINLNLNCV